MSKKIKEATQKHNEFLKELGLPAIEKKDVPHLRKCGTSGKTIPPGFKFCNHII